VRIGQIFDALLGALTGLAELPPEPGPCERADAVLARQRAAELEGQLAAELHRRRPTWLIDRGRPGV
jgi:hypothetical protein